jgi:hypothetical protein
METETAALSSCKSIAIFTLVGFRTGVALILRNHGPGAIVGKWNAIGGKRIDNHDLGLPERAA